MSTHPRLFIGLLLLATRPLLAEPIPLDTALQRAEEHSPALRAARAEADAARGEARQSATWANPSLSFESESIGADDGSETTVRLSQPFDAPGKRGAVRRVAASAVDGAEEELRLRQIELRRDVRKAFARVLAAEAGLEAATRSIERAERSQRAAAELVKAGAVPAMESDRARSRLAAAGMERQQAESRLRSARREMARLCGTGEAKGDLAAPPDVPPGDAVPTDHPRLAAARRAQEHAEALLEVARRERWPGIEVSAGYQQFEEGDSDAVAVGVSLALPVWDRRSGEQDAAKARIARAAAELDQASAEAAAELAEARENADNARASLTLLDETELPLARSVADAATKSYEAGATGLLDLLDALDRLAEAESRRIEWLLASWDAAADLSAWLEQLSPGEPR